MASDFDQVRSNLREQEPAPEPNQLGFILALVAVIALGGVIGFLILPKSDGTETAQSAVEKPLSKAQLKQMRRAELQKYRETQSQLIGCLPHQKHMSGVYQSYTARNRTLRDAWFKLLDPTAKLSQMSEMNGLEASAYMLTQGNGQVQDIMSDLNLELMAVRSKVDPIECGQLNAKVQRRELDLKPIPQT